MANRCKITQHSLIKKEKTGVVVHTSNPSMREAEAGGSQGQPGLQSEALFQKKNRNFIKKMIWVEYSTAFLEPKSTNIYEGI
jgi:hypothetical protein